MKDLVKANEHIALNKAFGTKEFGERLEEALKREGGEKKKTSFAPSSLGYNGKCPRYWYYAFHGAEFEYDTSPEMVANMDAGTAAGVRLAALLEKADLLVDSEIEATYKDPPIRGYIDALVRWKGEVIPAEIKTTYAETWQYRVNKNVVPGYQLLQLLIYMYVTKKDKGFFLTENKNTHQIFIYPVKMSNEYRKLVEDTFEWMRKVKANSEEDKLPTRPFTPSSKECKGCPVKKICWDGFKRGSVNGTDPNPGVIDLPPLEVPK